MITIFKKFFSLSLIFTIFICAGCGTSESIHKPVSSYYEEVFSSETDFDNAEENIEADENLSSEATNKFNGSTSAKTPLSNSSGGISSGGNTVSKQEDFLMGVWISCFEMPFVGADEKTATEKVDEMMKKVSSQGYDSVFCHVRPFGDAFYPSDYFPFSKYVSGTEGVNPGYDPLKIMINAAKKYKLEFHAWINPYRVSSSSSDPNTLSSENIAVKWMSDQSGRAVAVGDGIYFNPASSDVNKLILNGIREIISKYDVDGIHFDDYFYPTTNKSFDKKAYDQYKATTNKPLSLENWRRANVSRMVASVYNLCNKNNVTFGISPAGDISSNGTDRNYAVLYADIPLWMRTKGYVDYIIPQLYFGYKYPVAKSRYDRLLSIWSSLPKHKSLKLYIGLGAYKMNEPCDDEGEWHKDNTLMARQLADAYKSKFSGGVVFSYTASTHNSQHNMNQINNMFKEVEKIRSK